MSNKDFEKIVNAMIARWFDLILERLDRGQSLQNAIKAVMEEITEET